jgi:aryl-alcohol dehydrogenase-like predicted oxidoreductase
MIAKIPFGNTGHLSTRLIFGAASLWAMKQERADRILETLLKYGINHIDVAPLYGDAELRVGVWMKKHRKIFFLATKISERTLSGAHHSIMRSLERLQTDQIDLIQFHNLTDEKDWQTALGSDGALEAAIAARNRGLVRFIGVTGHGTQAPKMHLRSLERFNFDSVLLPYNYMMMQNHEYAADFERLIKYCADKKIAVQTIKSIARRRWQKGDTQKHFSWYEPIKDPDVLKLVVNWVLSRPNIFLNTSSDATLLPLILEAASKFDTAAPDLEKSLKSAATQLEMEPIFIHGMMDTV